MSPSDSRTPMLLVIDQSKDTGESLQLIGEASARPWQTAVADSLDAVDRVQPEPQLVLLHPGDDRQWRVKDMLALIGARGWSSKTVLVTNAQTPIHVAELEKLRTQHGLRALLPRPLDMALISRWLHETAPPAAADRKLFDLKPSPPPSEAQSHPGIAIHVDLLTPAVLVFSVSPENQVPRVQWANKSAKQVNGGQLVRADYRRLALLHALLGEDGKRAQPSRRAKCLDWDVDRGHWVECRLHTLADNQLFWYTRDWRADQAAEEEFAAFEAAADLPSRFALLTDYLAKRWTITRVRLYQVIRLPDGLGRIDDSNEHLHHDPVEMLDGRGDEAMPWMVVPRLQSGSGWPESQLERALNGAAAWWSHVFPWSQLEQRGDRQPRPGEGWRNPSSPASTDNTPELEEVQGDCAPSEVKTVAWGDSTKHRLMDVFPCERMKQANGTDTVLISAMLALDRRHDHVLREGDDALTIPTAERPRFTAAATSGRLGEALDEEEVQALAGGTLPAVRDLIARWLVQDHEDRARRWHKVLSRHILSGISTLAGSGGMAALSKVCSELILQWPDLWKSEMDQVQLPNENRATVRNWFFATEFDEKHIEVPAGAGPIWDVYQRVGQPLSKSSLVQRLWHDDLPDWVFLTVQDYPEWQGRNTVATPPKHESAVRDELAKVKTWVGIRLPQQQGFPRAMMVVHISDATCAAWSTVLHLLVTAAHRLYPPFMLALADEHERSAWAASVVHELKTSAATMHQALKQSKSLAASSLNFTRLIDIAHGIENLSRDYLSFLDPKYALFDANDLPAGNVAVKDQLHHALKPWTDRYPTRQCVLDTSALDDRNEQQVAAHHLWRRVIRVLLHNAFRHGKGTVSVRLDIRDHHLVLEVMNQAGPDAVAQLIAAHSALRGPISAPFATVRVGMRAARLLCRAAKAALDYAIECPESGEQCQVLHCLSWPLDPKDPNGASIER